MVGRSFAREPPALYPRDREPVWAGELALKIWGGGAQKSRWKCSEREASLHASGISGGFEWLG